MPINFTDSPANGATITQGNITYTYNSDKGVWNRTTVVANVASAIDEYGTLAELPLSGVEDDTLAKVLDTNKLYKWTGTGWYFLDPVNTNPTITTAGDAAYNLSTDGTPTVVTLAANDPEGFPIIWSYAVTAGSLGSTATVAQADNVFTITPSTLEANEGGFTITFTASDGVNIDTSTSEFSLTFSVANSRYTSLLAQAVSTGTNSTFVDASSETHTVTNTNVVAGTFSPYRAQGYSAYLDGAGDYFAINSGTVANFGTGDFTIEMWWNRKDAVDPGLVFESRPVDTQGDYITLSILGANIAYYAGSGAVNISTPHNVSVGDWAHLAVVRTGGYVKVYVNGTQIATSADTINYLSGSTPWIGKNAFQPGDWTNRISLSNYRITKAAAYTDNFTPSVAPLEAITGTTLLTFQSNRFVDNSGNNVGLIVSGNPEIVSDSPFDRFEYSEAFHGSSGYFNGSSSLTIPNDATLYFGSGDYTVEAWVYNTGTGNDIKWIAGIWHYITPAAQAWGLYHHNGQYIFVVDPEDTIVTTGTSGLHTNEWTHLAVTKSGNVFRMFINGVQESTTTLSHTMQNGSGALDIGAAGSGPANTRFGGHISDVHVIKGHAKYTADFAPPTAPIAAHANTTFLLNPDPSIIDKAQNAQLFEFYGNATGSDQEQLFSSSTMKFDGNGDYILLREGLPILSGGSFTIEAWARPSAWSSSSMTALFAFNAKTNGTNALMYTSQGINYGNSNYYSGSAPLTLNVWNHIAVTYDGTNLKSYVNGTLRTTNAYTPVVALEDCTFVIGAEFDGGNAGTPGNYFNGYIQDVRVSTGLVRYTANFTPPTALLKG